MTDCQIVKYRLTLQKSAPRQLALYFVSRLARRPETMLLDFISTHPQYAGVVKFDGNIPVTSFLEQYPKAKKFIDNLPDDCFDCFIAEE